MDFKYLSERFLGAFFAWNLGDSIQAFINIAVSMQLIPTTGVTFPFLSYGGSSIISMGIVMGMVLSLTKKKFKEKGLIYAY